MKTVVFAYHSIGIIGLKALQEDGWDIQAVFTHADDPGETRWFGSVRDWAVENGVPVHLPEEVNAPEWMTFIRNLAPEVFFSFYYRKLLSADLLSLASRGAYNLHGSLLPAYRGRCPVNWVLINGETRTGVTLHHMIDRPDAGDIVAQREVPIDPQDTALDLFRKLGRSAELLLRDILPQIREGTAPRRPQDLSMGRYYGGRRPEDGRIDWTWPALRIYNLIRAVTRPYPGAFTLLPDGRTMRVWWARIVPSVSDRAPGFLECSGGDAFVIAGDRNRIRLLDIELEGRSLRGAEIGPYLSTLEGILLK